jgi:hypothetical protein
MKNESWTKYTFTCDPEECDTLIEVTCDNYGFPSGVMQVTCPCGRKLDVLSVQDATIKSTTTEGSKMETPFSATIAPMTMKLEFVENDTTITKEYTESDVRHMVWQLKNLSEKQNQWYKKESQLRTLLEEVYADSEDQESLGQVAEIFDVPLTKEVEFTAWVRVDMTVEVELGGDTDSIEDFISQNLTVDSYDSLIQVNNHEVDRVEEGAY